MVLYANAFFCVQTIFLWTHGHALVSSGSKSGDSAFDGTGAGSDSGAVHTTPVWKSLVTNPNLIAVAFGLCMLLTGLRLPSLLQKPVNAMASVIGPVSMFTISIIKVYSLSLLQAQYL